MTVNRLNVRPLRSSIYGSILLLLLWPALAVAQVAPTIRTTVQTTSTATDSIKVGCAIGSSTCTGGVRTGTITVLDTGSAAINSSGGVTATSATLSGEITLNGATRDIQHAGATALRIRTNDGSMFFDVDSDNTGSANGFAWRTDNAAATLMSLTESGTLSLILGDFVVPPTKKVYLDGGTDTYIAEESANVFAFVAGGTRRLQLAQTSATFDSTVTSVTLSGGRLTIGGGSFATASIYKDATLGLAVVGVAGASFDFTLLNPAGNTVLSMATGSNDLTTADAFAVGGILTVGGFGQHLFSAGGVGQNTIVVKNSSAGAANVARIALQSDTGTQIDMQALSTTYTTSGGYVQDGGILDFGRAGGGSIAASNAAGDLRLYAGGSADADLTMTLFDTTGVSIGDTTDPGADSLRVAGTLRIVGAGTFDSTLSAGATTVTTLETGQGANELYPMNQGVTTTSAVRFDGGISTDSTAAGAANIRAGGQFIAAGDGTAGAPDVAVQSTAGAYTSGLFRGSTQGAFTLGISSGGIEVLAFSNSGHAFMNPVTNTSPGLSVNPVAYGTGNQRGSGIYIGRNTSGSGAAGWLDMEELDGTDEYLWVDTTGDLRISTAPPDEDGTPSDTSGTVVGDQTSWHAYKNILTRRRDGGAALDAVLGTDVYDFTYKNSGYLAPDGSPAVFTGLVGFSRSDWFMKNVGPQQVPALNEVNAVGYLVLSVQELERRLRALEAGR